MQRVALTAVEHLVGSRGIRRRAQGRFQQRRGRRPVQRLDLDRVSSSSAHNAATASGSSASGADRDDQPRRAAQCQLVHQRGRQVVQVVCVVDHEQQLVAVTGQRWSLRGTQQSAGLPVSAMSWSPAGRRTRRTGRSARSRCPPPSGRSSTVRGEPLGGSAGEQRLADAVGSDQHHAGPLGIVQGGRDPVQHGVGRRGNPSSRHRRILWRAPVAACG